MLLELAKAWLEVLVVFNDEAVCSDETVVWLDELWFAFDDVVTLVAWQAASTQLADSIAKPLRGRADVGSLNWANIFKYFKNKAPF